MAASAAYWIASAASSLTVTPGGDVGSVGVYAMHVDYSRALDEAGITVNIVKAGKYKAEGSPFQPLDNAARDHLQDRVDAIHGRFVAALARNRDVSREAVRQDFGQGRLVSARDAVSRKMADRTATLENVLERLKGGEAARQADTGRPSVEVMRLRQEHRKRSAALGMG